MIEYNHINENNILNILIIFGICPYIVNNNLHICNDHIVNYGISIHNININGINKPNRNINVDDIQ